MSREIKFRAWDSENQKMIFPSVDFLIESDGQAWQNVGDNEDKMEMRDWIPLQFTGEIDKNGNEIYEGDILRSSAELDKPRIAQVIFKDAQFRVIYPPHDFDSPLSFFVRLMEPKQVEIIGNIYENPELLNHAKA